MKRDRLRRGVGAAAAIVLAVGTLAACSPGDPEDRPISLTLNNNPWASQVMSLIPEFEAETGIKVEANAYSDEQIDQLYNVMLNAGSDELDVLVYRPAQNVREFQASGYLADLSGYVTTNAEWDWNDFQQSSRDSVTVDNMIYGVPITTEVGVIYYRIDLLEAAGLEVPTTMDELAAAAAKIHEENPDVFGFAARGEASAAVSQFSSFLYSFGADWTDASGDAAVDSPAAIEAFSFVGGLQNQYGPPGAVDMSWPQVMGLFQQGLVAFYPDASSLYNTAVDPQNSTVSEHTGVMQIPAGPAGSKPYAITSFALGVSEFSANKDRAWQFIEWITNKQNTLAFQTEGNPGARTSVWDDSRGTAGLSPDLLEVTRASNLIGVGHDRPRVVGVSAARLIVGKPIVAAILGNDVAEVASSANDEFQDQLDREASR